MGDDRYSLRNENQSESDTQSGCGKQDVSSACDICHVTGDEVKELRVLLEDRLFNCTYPFSIYKPRNIETFFILKQR